MTQNSERPMVPNALEWEVTYTTDGKKVTAKKLKVGAVVIWGLVVIGLCIAGHVVFAVPLSVGGLWRWFR